MTGILKRFLGSLVYSFRLTRTRRKNTLTILTFHRIVDEREKKISVNSPLMISRNNLEKMLKALSGRVHIISLEEADKWLNGKTEISGDSLVLTFDDGYLDNFKLAYPLLKQYNVPITVFLATDFIGTDGPYFWWDEVAFFFSQGLTPWLEDLNFTPILKDAVRCIEIASAQNRVSAVNRLIRSALYQVTAKERTRFVQTLTDLLSVSGVRRPRLMLNWNEVQEMNASGLVSFEPHTASHCLMNQCSTDTAYQEIHQSKKIIEQKTGRSCKFFSYPAGRIPTGYEELLTQSGISAAVTTRYDTVRKGVHPFLLPRKDAGYCFINGEFHLPFFITVCFCWPNYNNK